MEALKLEMERKRKEREASGVPEGGGKKKWVKRGDLEKARVAQYQADEAREAASREARLVVPCLKYREAPAPAQAAPEDGPSSVQQLSQEKENLTPAEIKRLLRQMDQPIALFGETEEERLERFRAVSAALPSQREEDLELKQGQMFNETQLYDDSGNAKQEGVQKEHEAVDDLQLANDEELEAAFQPKTSEQIVSRQFKQLVKLWEGEIGAWDNARHKSVEGRVEFAAYMQCRRHLKPFFKQLKSRSMPLDVLNTMIEITQYMQQRNYVKAHDAYIRCAIGNAPWPMGISGTGVHERQGRQHIRECKVAHVMNDETQRKYLQSVKRLLTFAQKALPPSGPSMMVS